MVQVTILGCGPSAGVPVLGGPDGKGDWGQCDPLEPRNRRRRCAVLVSDGPARILVDTPPDLREQLLDAGCSRLDAVLLTHEHADQLHGLDDLRGIALLMRQRVPVWGDAGAMASIVQRFDYCFVPTGQSGYPPILEANLIPQPLLAFSIPTVSGPFEVRPFVQAHGGVTSLGFRFGAIAYSSDVIGLPPASLEVLKGVDTWIVDCLRPTPSPSHAHLALVLDWVAIVRPRRTVLTNMSKEMDYRTLLRTLPKGIEPAFDGIVLEA